MAKSFEELRAKMSPERQEKVKAMTAKLLEEYGKLTRGNRRRNETNRI